MPTPQTLGLAAGSHAAQAGILTAADISTPVQAGLTGVSPFHVQAIGIGTGRDQVVPSWLQALVGRVVDEFGARTWWERVHVSPYYRDFGFHLSTQQITVYVWNASRRRARSSYEYEITGEDGVTLISPPAFPLHFATGLEYGFTVEVSEDGAPNFENNLIFRFADFGDAETDALLEGIRVVPFPIDPSGFIRESYGYLTRIITSMTDTEQRAALREIPVRGWSFDFVLTQRDMRIAQALNYGWSSRPFGVPIWYEETTLSAAVSAGDTVLPADVDLRAWDELALLWANAWTFEAVLISDITSNGLELGNQLLADWPAGTKLYPVRLARIDSRTVYQQRDLDHADASITFRGEDWRRLTTDPPPVPGYAGLASTTYQGREVLVHTTPNRGDQTAHEFLRPQFVLANPPGRARYNPRRDAARLGFEFRYVCEGRTAKHDLRAWVDAHFGALVPFWVPTYRRDLVITTDGEPSDQDLQVQPADYVRHQFPNDASRRHLAIYEAGSTPSLFRGVVSATEAADHEALVLDGTLGVNVTSETMVSYLVLVRLASDSIEIEHHGPEFAVATLQLLEVPAEVPVPV